jgi:hypothetical protein
MKGWLLVDADGCAADDDLQHCVALGVGYARGLPSRAIPETDGAAKLVVDKTYEGFADF